MADKHVVGAGGAWLEQVALLHSSIVCWLFRLFKKRLAHSKEASVHKCLAPKRTTSTHFVPAIRKVGQTAILRKFSFGLNI
jgi:hypothetical protein